MTPEEFLHIHAVVDEQWREPGNIFERKPGTDICDSCGTHLDRQWYDRQEIDKLVAEVERLKAGTFVTQATMSQLDFIMAEPRLEAERYSLDLQAEVERLKKRLLQERIEWNTRITELEGALRYYTTREADAYDGGRRARAALSQEKKE